MDGLGLRKVKKFVASLIGVIFSLTLVVSVHSQVTGATLSGSVTDASGAIIPGAEVSVKNNGTGLSKDGEQDLASGSA